MQQQTNTGGTPAAKTPASKKSGLVDLLKDAHENDPTYIGEKEGKKVGLTDLITATKAQEAAEMRSTHGELRAADNYEKEAQDASKKKLITDFDFTYEYMGGENYMTDDLHEIQAQRQPGVDVLKRGLNRAAGEFVLNVLETPGVVGGALAWAVTGDVNQMTKNFWVKAADAVRESLHESNPVYRSRKEDEKGVLGTITSGHWLATEGASALAFMGAALVPGLAVTKGAKMLSLTSKLAKGGARAQKFMKWSDKIAGKALKNGTESLSHLGSNTAELGNLVTTTLTNTFFEAGVEGKGGQLAFEDEIFQKYKSGEISYDRYKELIQESPGVAEKIFGTNMGILLVPNMVMSRMMLGPSAHMAREAHKNIRLSKAGKWIKGGKEPVKKTTKLGKAFDSPVAKAIGKSAKGFTENTLREGVWEEGSQMAAEQYFSSEYLDALHSGEDKRNFLKTYMTVLGSKDGQVASLTGGIISSPMSMVSRYREGKQLKKSVDHLLKSYSPTTNYFEASRNNIFELDDEGNQIMEYVDKEGNVVPIDTPGAIPKPKVDNTKLSELADAKEEVDILNAQMQMFLQQGELDAAAAISARLQAKTFVPYLRHGKEGIKALEDMMLNNPATDFAVNVYNKDTGEDITKQEYVSKEITKAKEMQKAMLFFGSQISAPLSSQWERDNKIERGGESEKELAKYREAFEGNYASQYVEAVASESEVKRQLSKAEDIYQASVAADQDSEMLERAKQHIVSLRSILGVATSARKNLEKSKTYNSKWNQYYKNSLRTKQLNESEETYKLDEAIKRVNATTTPKELRDVIRGLTEEGVILQKINKEKIPKDVMSLLGDNISMKEVEGVLTVLVAHEAMDQEEARGLLSRAIEVRKREAEGLTKEEAEEAIRKKEAEDAAKIKEAEETENEAKKEEEAKRTKEEEEARKAIEATESEEEKEERLKKEEQEKLKKEEERLLKEEEEKKKKEQEEEAKRLKEEKAARIKEQNEASRTLDKEIKAILTELNPEKRKGQVNSSDSRFDWATSKVSKTGYRNHLLKLIRSADYEYNVEVFKQLALAIYLDERLIPVFNKYISNFSMKFAKVGKESKQFIKEFEDHVAVEKKTDEEKLTDMLSSQGVPFGVQVELAKLIIAQHAKLKVSQLRARIQEFNRIAKQKGFIWTDILVGKTLVKEGSKVYWDSENGELSGTVRSIISPKEDRNGTNVLIEDTDGKLHVVNIAALQSAALDTTRFNAALNKKAQDTNDKEHKNLVTSDNPYASITIRSDSHPKLDIVDIKDPVSGEIAYTKNAFGRYVEEPRDKTNDTLEFSLNLDRARAAAKDPASGNNEEYAKAAEILLKIKAGEKATKEEIEHLIDWMPMSIRATRSDGLYGSAGTYMRNRGSGNNTSFDAIDRPIRKKIIETWAMAGFKLNSDNAMGGVTGNWGFQYTGVLNIDSNIGEKGNMVSNLKGVTLENMEIFAVGAKDSGVTIEKDGSRKPVPAELRERAGGVFLRVKDNTGKPFNLALRTNKLTGTPELEMIMMLLEDILVGNIQMNSPLPERIEKFLREEMSLLNDVFGKDKPTVGILYNTLVYQGDLNSQLGVSIDPQSRTLSIGVDTWSAEQFLDNKDSVRGMLGSKFRNINFPSNDLNKNKLPSTSNLKYLKYIIETKGISTNLKEGSSLFVGRPNKNNPNYIDGINTYLSAKDIKATEIKAEKVKEKEAPKQDTEVLPKFSRPKEGIAKINVKVARMLQRANYDPKTLSKEAVDFLNKLASKTQDAFVEAINTYNAKIDAAEDRSPEHKIKKCRL